MTLLAFYSPLPPWHTLTSAVSNIPKFIVLHVRPVKPIFYIMGPQILQKYRSHIKILGAKRVTWSKFHSVGLQILKPYHKTVEVRTTWYPEFVRPCFTLLSGSWWLSEGPPIFRTKRLFCCNLQVRFLRFYFGNISRLVPTGFSNRATL